ncbi:segmentation protein cap'n'collar [Condylostylus longicornis]|uniref:segmentation protein cap'n'collar n=1 Tax=Condylostylus longicornis TaxID=2530218 RepID=UPI00244E151B|nr:segmentation protein cap'n'collar [Condylostylus longicornis]
MISYKKSYAEQMLQLALALSLLQVDPDLYIGRNWDNQTQMRNGHAWELEMLRAVPITEYPYANRKAMMPLIEDLVRYDRATTVSNYMNITAYLLNVQNAQMNKTSNDQTNSTSTTTNVNSVDHGLASIITAGNTNNNSNAVDVITNQDLEQFINSEIPIMESTSIDFSEFEFERMSPFTSTFHGPLKDEPPDFSLPFDVKLEQAFDTASTSSSNSIDFNNDTHRFNDSSGFATWNELLNIKEEDPEPETNVENNLYTIDGTVVAEEVQIKSEDPVTEDFDNKINEENKEPLLSNVDITKEESEIVEVLWKQDVDLGFSLSPPKISYNSDATSSKKTDDENEKLKALEELKDEKSKNEPEKSDIDDEWAGIPFTIDNETGEYIRLPLQLDDFLQDVLQLAELASDSQEENKRIQESVSTSITTDLKDETSENLLLASEEKVEETLVTTSTSDIVDDANSNLSSDGDLKTQKSTDKSPDTPNSEQSLPSPLFDFDDANELEEEFDMMIQSAAGPFGHHQPPPHHRASTTAHHQSAYGTAMTNSAFRQSAGFHHHHHHHHHQSRVPPLSRGVSMEQRLQDIASLFNPMGVGVGEMAPYSHYPSPYYQSGPPMQHGQFPHHPVLHNSSLAAELGGPQPHYGHNLGSAVTSSMHLTNASHENDASGTAYKMEHDMMYYSNTSSELNHTADGFINSILNDEDLQLMDMGVNEGFCSMRMVDSNATSNNSSALGSTSGHSSQLHSSQLPNHLRNAGMHNNDGNIVGTSLGSDGMGSTGDRLDASSDSAVSSMGSERVPSLSDGEWGEGSDSAQDYHQGKYGSAATNTGTGTRPHDYSYSRDSARQPPVAQKKHQMYGKRYFQDQPATANLPTIPHASSAVIPPPHTVDHMTAGSIKYEYDPYTGLHSTASTGIASNNMEGAVGPLIGKEHHMANVDFKYGWGGLDFPTRTPRTPHEIISHNHTYTLPQGSGSTPRPQLRDKKSKKAEEEHLTRDEKRARSLNIPIPVHEIINLPMDEFNERLSKYDLTESQLSLIRDIRRRGKNKVAAQNCRKRKLDQILSLEDEVKEVRRKKEQYYSERDMLVTERNRVSNKFAALHRHIFQYLRDPDGNPCSPNEYSLQQAADGSVYLIRRDTNKPVETNTNISNNATAVVTAATTNAFDANGAIGGNSAGANVSGIISTSNSHHYHPHHHHSTHHSSQQRPSPSSSQHHQKE